MLTVRVGTGGDPQKRPGKTSACAGSSRTGRGPDLGCRDREGLSAESQK
jgi:hypothetical protein